MNPTDPLLMTISPDDLVCMNAHSTTVPLIINLAYAQDGNLLFGERIYKKEAQLWLHRDLAEVVLEAARLVKLRTGGCLVVYDGLRVIEAQAAMLETQRVKDHPQWLEEPRLLSPPGKGGHPRGMAVDVSIQDTDGALLNMGSDFDYLCDDPSPLANTAHRDYAHPQEIRDNRDILDQAMMDAAAQCGVTLLALPQEWWDFRLPSSVYDHYAPLSDADLPAHMRLMD